MFFSQLKGSTRYQAELEAAELTSTFHLEERLDHTGSELSGGQRRKLSVAIAVCGGSKFVVLDEPTVRGPCRAFPSFSTTYLPLGNLSFHLTFHLTAGGNGPLGSAGALGSPGNPQKGANYSVDHALYGRECVRLSQCSPSSLR